MYNYEKDLEKLKIYNGYDEKQMDEKEIILALQVKQTKYLKTIKNVCEAFWLSAIIAGILIILASL